MTPAPSSLAPVLPLHERWFVEPQQAGDWSFFFSPLPLVLTAAVVLVTVLWRVVALRFDRPELPFLAPLGRLVPWVPRLLGIHLGVALLALAAEGTFMTPANDDLHGVGGTALGECANLAAVAAFLLVVPPGADAHGAAHPSKAQLRPSTSSRSWASRSHPRPSSRSPERSSCS